MEIHKQIRNGDTAFWLDDWHVDPAAGRISRQGAEVRLEPRVMSVLVLLAAKPGVVMSREAIETEVWKGMVVGYDALASTIIKLRKALGDDSRQPRYVETVSKKGYRLIAPVHSSDASGMPVAETIARQRFHSQWLFAAAVLLLGSVATLALWQHQVTADNNNKPALVVLPFTNLSDNPQQDYFSDGITEDLIIDLSRYSGLSVISPRTTFSFKTRTVDLQMLADELGVRYVVEGSVRLDEKHLRINVQLIEARSGVYLWTQRYDREVSGLFDVQDEVRQKIVNALEITLTRKEQARLQQRYTNSFEAYDLFLRGQAMLVRRSSQAANNQAMDLMQQAIAIDPGFARAHAALALIYADAYRFDWTDEPQQTRLLALQSGRRAIEIDSELPQAYWIMGYIQLFLYQNHEQAVAMAERSLQLHPSDADAVNLLAVAYAFGDEPQKARLLTQELMQNNQYYSAMVPSVLALANLRLGHYEEALEAYDRSLMINPARLQGNVFKIVALYRMGRISDAEFQVDELYNLHPNFKLSVWIKRQPFKDQAFADGLVTDLVDAGVSAN